MISRLTPIAILALLAASTVGFCADPSVVVKRAEMAGASVSYRGLKIATVYFGGRYTTSTLKVLHKRPDKTRTDFFAPSSIAGVIVIQNGDRLWTYSPSLDTWEERPTSSKYSPDAVHLDVTRNYDLKILGKEQVAGRPAFVVYAVPRNAAEPARRIWVDESSYLVMKTQQEDRRGTVLNSSHYVSIEMNPKDISPDAFNVTGNILKRPEPGGVQFKLASPKYLPPGYRLITTSTITVNGLTCAHVQFSNGTNLISLFQRKGGKVDTLPSPMNSKTTNVLTWSRDGMVYTLIGDVPSSTLSKIANSIR